MTKTQVATALALALAVSPPAVAQTASMYSGQTFQWIGSGSPKGSCYVGRGPSAFQRNGAAGPAYMSFPELWYGGRYDLSGHANLYFSTTNAGKIYFKGVWDIDPSIAAPSFANYAQSYNSTARRLTVSFGILFPNCTLYVSAVYDGT